MRLIFVHGWGVTSTSTYGNLPQALARHADSYGLDIDVQHIMLGQYISFHDEITMDDVVIAFDAALNQLDDGKIKEFSCVTHSTGGPVVRQWVEQFYGADQLDKLPLKHLVMLAPANHGSPLAVLGKQRVGRIKAWFGGVEPGQKILDWLSLGSKQQWWLNEQFLDYDCASQGFYPFVLAGQGTDRKLYDFLNNYLVEPGSDGVVRVAGANLNSRFFLLQQSDKLLKNGKKKIWQLTSDRHHPVRSNSGLAMAVLSSHSHSGRRMGIMAKQANSSITHEILACLNVSHHHDYNLRVSEMEQLTHKEQDKVPKGRREKISRYAMLVFRVRDQFDAIISYGDYDLYLLAGSGYSPNQLPKGFFMDRQMNESSHSLVYYLDCEKMYEIKDGKFGVRIVARPELGFSGYQPGEYQSDGLAIEEVLVPNQTTYIDIVIHRKVDRKVFEVTPKTTKARSFKRAKPTGELIN